MILLSKKLLILALASFLALLFGCSRAPSEREQLNAIRDEIGINGIMDYVLDYWTDNDVIDYLYYRSNK